MSSTAHTAVSQAFAQASRGDTRGRRGRFGPGPYPAAVRPGAYGAAGSTTTGPSREAAPAVWKLGPSSRTTASPNDLQERVGRLEETHSRRAVVHRHDPAGGEAVDDLACLPRVDRRAAADRHEHEVDPTDRRRPARRAARAWPKSPKWAIRRPSRMKTKIVFGPRCVPAAASCSEATATTSPTGDSKRARGRAQHARASRRSPRRRCGRGARG